MNKLTGRTGKRSWCRLEGGRAKGAPETIADLCHFDAERRTQLERQVRLLAQEGIRVLGVAKAAYRRRTLPDGQHDFDFQFLGLIGLSDPVREAVPAAIHVAQAPGICPTDPH